MVDTRSRKQKPEEAQAEEGETSILGDDETNTHDSVHRWQSQFGWQVASSSFVLSEEEVDTQMSGENTKDLNIVMAAPIAVLCFMGPCRTR